MLSIRMLAMKLSRSWLNAGLLLTLANFGYCREPTIERFEFSQIHMGTLFRIVLYAPDAERARLASDAAFRRIAELDDIMSDYKPASELMQLCARAGGPPVAVSEDLFRVVAAAQDLAERSDGAFDVTVGPVVRLWRRARRRHELPDPERLAKALDLVGCQKLRLDPKARTAQLLKPGMLLDLGGIAKGYAADEALATLKRYGIESALVAGGGDIAVGSAPPGKAGWRIAIAPLEPQSGGPMARSQIQNPKSKIQNLLLRDAAVSTSGDAEQHVEIGGVRYSHIVDPKTGMALTGRSSVTVLARNCTTSDGLATAVSVIGPERGLELIKDTPGAGALFVKETAEGLHAWALKFPRERGRLARTPSAWRKSGQDGRAPGKTGGP
jgi:FAD:protein FMN transferase